jgi:hypothetical protein
MPLRDHFRPPVNHHHAWDELHGQWPAMMVLQLTGILPPEYTAAPQVHLGGAVEIDVGTYEKLNGGNGHLAESNGGGIATAVWTETKPSLSLETELPEFDEYEVRIYDVERQRRLVAAIELVSPSSKDRPESRRAFVAKCATLLLQGVSVTIVDVVTTRESNLYDELVDFLDLGKLSVAESKPPIYAAACRGIIRRQRWKFETWHQSLNVGQPLPRLPVWLAEDLVVPLDLESSYEETCRVLRIA